MMKRLLPLLSPVLLCATSPFAAQFDPAQTLLVEAESFDVKPHLGIMGAWVVDQQFMDQMGSPFLLAHGLGFPCEDVSKSVSFPAPGTYRVWVRTRDWVATWNAPGAPGKFQILVNGQELDTVFGTEGAQWHWQDGGTVEIASAQVKLTLKDLTGFDGRCDAILFSRDPAFTPPHEKVALAEFRRKALGLPDTPPDAGDYDLVVVGGGLAGTAAAVGAARLGAKVALVQDRPVLGGNGSSEVRVHPRGGINLPPYPNIGNLVYELVPKTAPANAEAAHYFDDPRKYAVVEAEENLDLHLNTHAYAVEMEGDRIVAVLTKDICTSEEKRFPAKLFADCTGDGNLGFLAGAEFRMGREGREETRESLAPPVGDKMTMGTSVMWRSRDAGVPVPFPECPWALQFNERSAQRTYAAEWFWETGMNLDQIEDFEQVRDHGLRAAFGNWDFLKNKSEAREPFANRELEWVAHIGGKRESRRLLGDIILTEMDVLGPVLYPDAAVTCTWSIDLHYPDPENSKYFPGEEFLSTAKFKKYSPAYPIPYRCFYSRNIENLFMAGRNISVTHVALGTVRVMRTTGMMGEVVGLAAAIANRHDATPREVYEKHLEELKTQMKQGVPKRK